MLSKAKQGAKLYISKAILKILSFNLFLVVCLSIISTIAQSSLPVTKKKTVNLFFSHTMIE